MSKENQPLPFVNKIPRRLRMPVYAGITALAGLVAACSGGGSKEAATPSLIPTTPPNTPIPTETIRPTFTPSPTPRLETSTPTPNPTPEATPKPEPKKISEAKFVPTTIETLRASVDLAYQRHPDIAEMDYLRPGQKITREGLENNLTACQSGRPDSPRTREVDMISGCSNITSKMYIVYQRTDYEEAYLAALNGANYLLTELPHRQPDLNRALQASIQDTSPSLN